MEIQSKCFPSKTSFLKDSFVDVLTYLSPPPNLSVLLPSNFSESCRHGMAGLGYSCAKQLVKGAYFFLLQEVISNRSLISNSTWCASHVHRLFTEKWNSGGVAVHRGLGCHRY